VCQTRESYLRFSLVFHALQFRRTHKTLANPYPRTPAHLSNQQFEHCAHLRHSFLGELVSMNPYYVVLGLPIELMPLLLSQCNLQYHTLKFLPILK
jgi:hypothetical protein